MGEIDESDLLEAVATLVRAGAGVRDLCDVLPWAEMVEGCVCRTGGAIHVTAEGDSSAVEYDSEYTAEEAALEYVYDGDWSDGGRDRQGATVTGAVEVQTWRMGVRGDGEIVQVDAKSHTIDVAEVQEWLHLSAIRAVMGSAGCGDDPDDHEWTSEGEGGCDENPGVWSTGGTGLVSRDRCARCGLQRRRYDPGRQRNPGEGVSVRYMHDADE